MKFFVDTANVEDIKKANDMGVICGVTTNPSLIAKEGRDFNEVIKEITSIVDGPISGEVKATTVDAEGQRFLISMDMIQRLLQLQSETRFMSQTVHLQELISQQFLTRLSSR